MDVCYLDHSLWKYRRYDTFDIGVHFVLLLVAFVILLNDFFLHFSLLLELLAFFVDFVLQIAFEH